MNYLEKKYLDNSFILLGRTGNGKSTACKAYTRNENIEISSSKTSCTSEVSYYGGQLKNNSGNSYYFTMIDTPGLDDSKGRDKEIYQKLRDMFQTKNMKVKGIFIFLNFLIPRFGQSEQNIIDKIIELVPIQNFWKYITIIVTHSYSDKPKKFEAKKNEFKQDLKKLLGEKYFFKYFCKYGISGKFEDIKIVFTNFDDEEPSLEDYNAMEIKAIIENSLYKEPLFKECKQEIQKNVPVLDYKGDSTRKTATLLNCEIRNIKFYGQNGDTLNEIRTIIDKKTVREIEKSELESKDSFLAGGILYGISLISLAGLAFPPLEIFAAIGYFGAGVGSLISEAVGWSQEGINAYKNSYFKNEEINSFLDETK